jgi:hypothetical protein
MDVFLQLTAQGVGCCTVEGGGGHRQQSTGFV